MNFKDPVLEKAFKKFKWTRNNTILLFEEAKKQNILSFVPKGPSQFTFKSILNQFQCVVATTDAYYRKLMNHPNTKYGILVVEDQIIPSKDLTEDIIGKQLDAQIRVLQTLFAIFESKDTEEHIDKVMTISDHEYIHFGELILMFRQAGVDLPDRVKKAWAL